LDFEARYVVDHFNASPMETGDGGGEAEAEPVAGSAATSFKPVEALEDVLIFIDGNSRSVIGDRNDGTAVGLFDLYGYLTRVTAMFDGVIDEIGHRIEQEVSVARGEHAPTSDDLETPTLVLRRGIE
jgi:hypothetical protein